MARRTLYLAATIAASVVLVGFAMPTDNVPPNTVVLSEMMRELSAKPGFTETFLREIQNGKHKTGPALLTPDLVHALRDIILGKNWQALDRFPGWTMAEITPTVRVVGHYAGKDQEVTGMATAGGRHADAMAQFLDLGDYAQAGSAVIDGPATGKGFDEKEFVSALGDGVTRGDGPNDLAPLHAESTRLAEVLNRLSLNEPAQNGAEEDGVQRFPANFCGSVVTSPEGFVSALIATGHSVTVTDSRYFANFGHLHWNGRDVMMPFFVNSQILLPGTKRPLLVPVSHAEYEWHIRGPKLNADVSFYFGIDGKAEFRTVDQLDQAWVMKRNAHMYGGSDAVEVTRLSGSIVRAYMRLHAAHPAIPFGGYFGFGVCQDVVAAIELKMTGKTTLFPNTADGRFFVDPRDAEVNDLIRRLPKDRDGKPPAVERIFGSLPVGDSDAELATVTIPELGTELVAVHDAWAAGTLKRTEAPWVRRVKFAVVILAVLGALGFAVRWRRRAKHPA